MNFTKEADEATINRTFCSTSTSVDKPFGCEEIPVPKSVLDIQEGGDHYKKYAIQPIEFIHKNNIPFEEANCIKYLCRHRDKGGAKDIRKVIHYCQLILEFEYNEKL